MSSSGAYSSKIQVGSEPPIAAINAKKRAVDESCCSCSKLTFMVGQHSTECDAGSSDGHRLLESSRSGLFGRLSIRTRATPRTPDRPAVSQKPSIFRRMLNHAIYGLASEDVRRQLREKQILALRQQMEASSGAQVLSSDEVSLLATMCARDITPDDFATLCRLDEVVDAETPAPPPEVSFDACLAVLQAQHPPTPLTSDLAAACCGVCLDEIDPACCQEDAIALPGCCHVVHVDCMRQWVATKHGKWICPVDKHEVIIHHESHHL